MSDERNLSHVLTREFNRAGSAIATLDALSTTNLTNPILSQRSNFLAANFPVQRMVHSLAVDTATQRMYAPEQQENGHPVARMIVYEAGESAQKH